MFQAFQMRQAGRSESIKRGRPCGCFRRFGRDRPDVANPSNAAGRAEDPDKADPPDAAGRADVSGVSSAAGRT